MGTSSIRLIRAFRKPLIVLPVRELDAKTNAFSTLSLENSPLGVRSGNWQPEKSETGTGTSLEGRVTCRN